MNEIADPSREQIALWECYDLLCGLSRTFRQGSELHARISQVQLRVLWLLRHQKLSSSQLYQLQQDEKSLRAFLELSPTSPRNLPPG